MRTPFPVVLTGALAGSLGLLAAAQQKPAFERAPDALERVTWRTRTLVSDDRLTNWNFAIPGGGLTFLETVVRADAAVVTFVEASSTQAVGARRHADSRLRPHGRGDRVAQEPHGRGPPAHLSRRRRRHP